MDYKTVIYEKEGQVAYITLNRPDKLNSVSPDLVEDWEAAITEAELDDDVKVVVFKGAGRCFSAGAPLDKVGFVYGMKEPKPGEKPPKVPQRVKLNFDKNLFYDFHRRILYCKKLTIAQLHQYCLGIAFTIVLHCDLILATEDCQMGHVEERLGLGGMTISPMMVLRCGYTTAIDLCLSGKMITGKQASDYRLINRTAPDLAALEKDVRELANGLALYPKDGIRFGKVMREMLFSTMGVDRGLMDHYVMHSFQTNRVYDPGEFNFFKQRKDKGVKNAAHDKHDHFSALDK
jgi:enoyl-CoA hydratase